MSIATHSQTQYATVGDPLEAIDWAILYDDGEAVVDRRATGKLSLDSSWALVLRDRTVVLAIPAHRVIEVGRVERKSARAA